MHGECLEELWTVADSLWMLDNHTDRTRSCTVSDLNPIATQTYRVEMIALNKNQNGIQNRLSIILVVFGVKYTDIAVM